MKQMTLANWLRLSLIILALIGGAVYAVIVPAAGMTMKEYYPEFADRFYPWLFFLLSTALPCYAALGFAWRIVGDIGRDKSFSRKNARRFRWIAALAFGTALYFLAGNLVLGFFGMSHPGIFILSLLFVLTGIAIGIACAALAHQVAKAAALQDESDLTV